MSTPPPSSDRPPSGGGRGLPWLLAAGGLVAAAYLATELWLLSFELGFPLDDSWIHLTFARSLARGEGLSYGPGGLVTGSTAPLWTALLSLAFLLPGNALLWAKLAGTAAYLGSIHATYRLGRELDLGRGLAHLAAAMVLATHWLAWSALSGMEICPFVWLSLWGMILQVRERRDPGRAPLALAAFGAAALLRPEGLLLLALAVLDRCLRPERTGQGLRLRAPAWDRLAAGLGLAALLLLPVAAFYAWIGGSPLPTTFGAKAGAARSWLPDPRYLYTVAGIFLRPQPVLTLLAGGGALLLAARLGSRRDRGLLPALWVFGLPLAYSLLTPQGKHLLVGNLGRYYFPLFPPLILLGVLALEPVAALLAGGVRAGRLWLPVRPLLLVALLLPTLGTLLTGATRYAQNVANVQDGDVGIAGWLRHNVDPRAVLAVQDVGALGFFLPNPLLDLSGIVTPEIQAHIKAAVSPQDPYGQGGMVRFLEERRPDFLVVFPRWYPAIVEDRSRFRAIHRLEVEGNVTLAGDEIVVYATPWTRYPVPASPAPAVP